MSALSRLLMLAVILMLTAPARALTESECRRDSQELLEEISRNRRHSNEQFRQAMAEANTEQERATLREQKEQIWHQEEIQLGVADQALRDCLRHVQFLKQKSVNQ